MLVETLAHCLCLFFNEHEVHVKTARILRLFFNEHELCAKTARLPSHMIRMSHVRFHFLWSLRLTKAMPCILSLCKLGNG